MGSFIPWDIVSGNKGTQFRQALKTKYATQSFKAKAHFVQTILNQHLPRDKT